MSESLIHSLNAFKRATCMDQNPQSTLIQRMLILRTIYLIKNINISICISKLEDCGLFIGKYDASATERHMIYKVSSMDIHDTIRLITSIEANTFNQIFTELRETYENELERSPLWCLKKTFEENQISTTDAPNLLLHVFIVIHNRDIEKDRALHTLLSTYQNGNVMDLVLRILGSTNSNSFQEHLETDMCVVMKFSNFNLHDYICENMNTYKEGITHNEQTPQLTEGRFSLLLAQRQMSSKNNEFYEVSDNNSNFIYYPSDVISEVEEWKKSSYAQKQLLLLILCINPSVFSGRYKTLSRICNITLKPEINEYIFKVERHRDVFKSIFPMLHRLGDYVDVTCTDLLFLISNFTETCYNGIFGVTQRKLMTVAFNIQMYVVAYLDQGIQIKSYKVIVEMFNRCVKNSNPELVLCEYIPPLLSNQFNAWCKKNDFSNLVFENALKPLFT